MDGKKAVRNSLRGELRWEGVISVDGQETWVELRREEARTEAWTWSMDRKPWEIASESCVGKEQDGSVETVDGWETVGNSLVQSFVWRERDRRDGSMDTVDGQGSFLSKERGGSMDIVDGQETVSCRTLLFGSLQPKL